MKTKKYKEQKTFLYIRDNINIWFKMLLLIFSFNFKRNFVIQTEMGGWFRQTFLCTFQNSNKTFSTNIISSFLNLGPEFYASFSALGFLSQKDFKLEKNLSLFYCGEQFFSLIQLQLPSWNEINWIRTCLVYKLVKPGFIASSLFKQLHEDQRGWRLIALWRL